MDQRQVLLIMLLELWHLETMCACAILVIMMMRNFRRNQIERHSLVNRSFISHDSRLVNLHNIIGNDVKCVNELRMDIRTFGILCDLLRTEGRLTNDGLVSVEEQVCVFLHILAHHVKIRSISNRFFRSGETISRYFNLVLQGVLRLQGRLLKAPEPVGDNCIDPRWKCFKNCLGALDGTYINVRVAVTDKPRYRTRKGQISTNVLGVCSRDMQFIFVLPGWEGSASDSRVLRDALSRPNGLKVPSGQYYLVDGGYMNGECFLAPYRGKRYHLSEWEGNTPVNYHEYFNMKHAKARNVIERCFGLLKIRWGILRSPSYYPIKTQCRIITACCLLHNLIRKEMSRDPMEHLVGEIETIENVDEGDMSTSDGSSEQWNVWRDDMALKMGYSPLEQIAALKIILEKPSTISMFMSLDEDIKKVYVEQLLLGNV